MQQWFNLSDPAAEDALYDSETMRRFVGVDLGEDAVPGRDDDSPLPASVGTPSADRAPLRGRPGVADHARDRAQGRDDRRRDDDPRAELDEECDPDA